MIATQRNIFYSLIALPALIISIASLLHVYEAKILKEERAREYIKKIEDIRKDEQIIKSVFNSSNNSINDSVERMLSKDCLSSGLHGVESDTFDADDINRRSGKMGTSSGMLTVYYTDAEMRAILQLTE